MKNSSKNLILICLTSAALLTHMTNAIAQNNNIFDYSENVLYSFRGTPDGIGPSTIIQANDGNFYGTTYTGGINGNTGTVFKITPSGVESVLYSFGLWNVNMDGQTPYAGLIQARDDNFYGTTFDGGTNNDGTVFKVTSNGVESVLYSFGKNSDDGQNPYGSLIQASDGNFYGTTRSGGNNSMGTVFKVTPSGIESVLYSFGTNSNDGSSPWDSLIQARDGNFYGTTYLGGTNGVGAVFKITTAGIETVLHSFGDNTKDGQSPIAGLIQANDGNFYGTTYTGGTNNYGTVFEITSTGVETVLYSFGNSSVDGQSPRAGLIQTSDGDFYGTTTYGGINNDGTAFKVTPNGIESVLYSFGGSSGNGRNPVSSLIQTTNGNFYGTTNLGGANGFGAVFKIK